MVAGDGNRGYRFIPTHVGNTLRIRKKPFLATVHPHACGEHTVTPAAPPTKPGSSPRMWGTLGRREPSERRARFIPTHVGNTRQGRMALPGQSVHPHACGEHRALLVVRADENGSSPRMWGTRPTDPGAPGTGRFIPTHVGNTWAAWAFTRLSSGSSPRMWGTPVSNAADRKETRFIPTHVGNTCVARFTGSATAVHPHACGEHARDIHVLAVYVRFIPTHVGNTPTASSAVASGSVHPHACGEHRLTGDRGRKPYGSSPRMWGTHCPSRKPL